MKLKRLLCCIFLWVFIFNLSTSAIGESINADSNAVFEQKVESNATIEDDFAIDRVMIILNNAESLKLKSYSSNDFSEIDCELVTDLTFSMRDQVQTSLQANTNGQITSINLSKASVDVENYHQVLCLKLKHPGKENVLKAIKQLELRNEIVYAGPDYAISLDVSDFNRSNFESEQWALEKISLSQAWNYSTGSSSIKVGVLDTGIDGSHPDLSDRVSLTLNRDFTSGEEVSVSVPTDGDGHGTHVAGIIGAKPNNGIGVDGVCWNVELVSLKIFNDSGQGYSSHLAKAILYAQRKNIPILNFSGRWYSSSERYDYALDTVINNYSGLFVCAAGNENRDNSMYNIYPANFQYSNLITVGASTESDRKLDISNFNNCVVDIFAPGEDVYSTYPNSDYVEDSGTSMAAPYVAGVAALMMAENPHLSPAAIKQIIIRTADTVYDENGNSVFENLCVSGGRLNAYAALRACHLHEGDNIEYEDDWHTVGSCTICEVSEIEQSHHLIPYKHYTTYEHYGVCACGYVQFGYHVFDLYVNSVTSENTHYVYCACGSEKSYYHVYISADPGSNYNWICRDCGKTSSSSTMPTPQSLVSGDVMMQMNSSGVITLPDGTTLQILTETGSYVLSNGIIVLSPEDAALVEAGLLDLYELVESVTVPTNPDHVTE